MHQCRRLHLHSEGLPPSPTASLTDSTSVIIREEKAEGAMMVDEYEAADTALKDSNVQWFRELRSMPRPINHVHNVAGEERLLAIEDETQEVGYHSLILVLLCCRPGFS